VELKKAQSLDPLSPAISTWIGEAFAHLGEHEAAIRIHRETIRLSPDYLFAHYFLVRSYVATDRLDDAANAAAEAVKLSDDMSLTRSASIFLKARTGDREGAQNELRGLIEKRDRTYVSAVNIASGFAVLNETDNVFKWLETALAERDSNLTWLNIDAEFDYLRDDSRFLELVKQVNLSDATRSQLVQAAAVTPAEVSVSPEKKSKVKWFAIAAVAAAATIAFAAYLFYPRTAAALDKNKLTRLTNGPFDDTFPAFTHDGRIRFARYLDKHTLRTYVMNSDGTGVQEQTQIPGMTTGLYSPDGTKILFNKDQDTNVYLANADGSDVRVVPFHPGNCQWSSDSKQLVYQAQSSDKSVANNSDIFIYDFESGKISPVVESPFYDSDPAFSPDGKSIVYVSDVDGNFEVYSRVVATGETRRLTHNPGHEAFPSYTPDGTQIIFNSDREKENGDVYIMDLDGGNIRKLTDGPGWDACFPNSWSPDGTQVLIMSDRGGKDSVYLMNIEPFAPTPVNSTIKSDQLFSAAYSPAGDQIVYISSNDIRIFDVSTQRDRSVYTTISGAGPTFSPDGGKIVFQERIDDNTEICSVNADGSDFRNLTQHPGRDMAPSYSPDGSKIAFSSNRAAGTTTFEIYVMNADGSDPKMVFGDRAMSIGARWSPDGRSLVFANDREDGRVGNFELFSMSADGGTPARLTTRPKYDVEPVFSPDGKRIAFVSNADGNPEIYLMNTDGSGLLRLTRDPAQDVSPQWSPDGSRLIFTSNRTGKYELYEIRF
jgi:Tol biopolymer transport system component